MTKVEIDGKLVKLSERDGQYQYPHRKAVKKETEKSAWQVTLKDGKIIKLSQWSGEHLRIEKIEKSAWQSFTKMVR